MTGERYRRTTKSFTRSGSWWNWSRVVHIVDGMCTGNSFARLINTTPIRSLDRKIRPGKATVQVEGQSERGAQGIAGIER